MSQITPGPVAEYLGALGSLPHPCLERIAADGRARGLPIVDAATGALLHALARAAGARRALEIGTAVGYSAVWIATALPADGMLITIERHAERAAAARQHFRDAGFDARISVVADEAVRAVRKTAGPFDLIFQDGDKTQYATLLDPLVARLRPGGVLVTDNVLWNGEVVPGFVAHPERDAAATAAIADYNRRLARDARLYTVFLPVGDGVAVSVRLAGP